MQVQTSQRQPHEPLQNVELFERAWDECIELQEQPKQVWVGTALAALAELPRYEIFVVQDQRIVGALVLAHDSWDVHVGPCMSVFTQYVLPEYRNSGVSLTLMRAAIRITRSTGTAVLAYTHRTAPWRYETIYRRVA